MARGKRRRPLLASSDVASRQIDDEENIPHNFDDGDDIEDFVNIRHTQMARNHGLEDSDSDRIENEPENMEYDVLNISASDSDDSDSDILHEADAEDARDEDGEKEDWGGKRRNWYGGDTHEYEIMEDEEREEVLQDEEEEVIRLQEKALHRTRPEDYLDDEDEYAEVEDQGEEHQKAESVPSSLNLVSAPELKLLAREFQKSLPQLAVLKKRIPLNEVDRIKYQLLSLFVTNVALYFSVRTDPDSVSVDLRTHPVLARIIQIRSLLRNTGSVPSEILANGNVVHELSKGELDNNNGQGRTKRDRNEHLAENGTVIGKEKTGQKLQNRKRKKKHKEKSGAAEEKTAIAADEERIQSLLQRSNGESVVNEEQTIRDQKRRKFNKIVGAMERERKNNDSKRMASADLDVIREKVRNAEPRTDYDKQVTGNDGASEVRGLVDDDEVMTKMLAKREKKEARKARKAAASTPHVYRFKDEVPSDGKRKASTQVVKNRGLTRYRPRDKKTPRTKNRLAYDKAVVRRKGAVREYSGAHGGSYGGEASGINISARKGSML